MRRRRRGSEHDPFGREAEQRRRDGRSSAWLRSSRAAGFLGAFAGLLAEHPAEKVVGAALLVVSAVAAIGAEVARRRPRDEHDEAWRAFG